MQVRSVFSDQSISLNMSMADRIDEVSDPDYIYVGFQVGGVAEDAAGWLILRIDISTTGITKREWSNNGSNTYDQKWSLRTSYTNYANKTW